MGMFSSDEKDDIFNANTESKLRERIAELEVRNVNLTNKNTELEERLENQKHTINTLLDLIGKGLDAECIKKVEQPDFLGRQKRIFQNKVNHGFNTTNIYQEARYILEEVAELMRAVEKNDRENMLEELADIVIFSYGCAEVARLGDLDTKIFDKMRLNEKRVYKKNCDGDFVKTAITKT